MSRFADTRPRMRMGEDLDKHEARQRAIVVGLVCALISALLSIGAIASLPMVFG